MVRNENHAIQAGHVTVGSFTSSHIIKNFPLQTNQTVIPWTVPILSGDMYPTPAEFQTALSGKVSVNGFYRFSWTFSLFSTEMYSYWLTTFLPSSVWSANVTVRTYTETDTAIYLQCLLQKPQAVSPDKGSVIENLKFNFVHGVIIT